MSTDNFFETPNFGGGGSKMLRYCERVLIVYPYAELIEMTRTSVNYSFCIRASPAFKCICETSYTLSSYVFFSPKRNKGGRCKLVESSIVRFIMIKQVCIVIPNMLLL